MPISLQEAQLRELKAQLQQMQNMAIEMAIKRLTAIGEQAIAYARKSHPKDYTDQTENLRSSVAYVLLNEGQIIVGGTPQGTPQGTAAASKLLDQIAAQHPHGLVLIVVAGMHYALYVEAHQKDVLSGAELLAQRLARQQITPHKNMLL